MNKTLQHSELYQKHTCKSATRNFFHDWVATHLGGPAESLDRYFHDAVASAETVGAQLEALPILDGQRHYLPNLAGKRDQKQYYRADLRRDADGTCWPSVTFATYRHGGSTLYWCPRDLAWAEFRANPAASSNRRDEYQVKAQAAQADAAAVAAEAEHQADLGRIAAREAAQAAWSAGLPAESHPYLTRKGVHVPGLRIAAADLRWRLLADGEWKERWVVRKGDLLIPMHDAGGQLVNLQRIDGSGKWFLPGGQAKGCRFMIEGGPRVVLCEGLATGASWHQATGDTVIVVFSAGNLLPVAETVRADLVAADHDESGTGERYAKATGLAYLMPPLVGHDWNDHIAKYGPGELLASLHGIPVFSRCPAKAERLELQGKAAGWWKSYGQAETPEDAARWAWTLALRLYSRVPVHQSLDDLMDELRRGAPAGLVRSETLAAIQKRLAKVIAWRKTRALRPITLSSGVTQRHRHEIHENLPELTPGEYRGVILLKAPMGTGKTQLIGKPFAAWAKGEPGKFLACCHRRSLVRELSNRLGSAHYQEVTADMAFGIKSLSTCLPSLVKDAHEQIIQGARFVFIDEIAQVIRSLDAHVTVADGKTKADLFSALREVVAQAECLIGADAGLDDRTLAFLGSCRPGERFRIIEVPHQDTGRRVQFGFGQAALAHAYGEALTRLAAGERLWISCGEQTRAIEVARVLQASGKRILLLHGDNTGHPESAAFFADPEGESRKYDCVIHTSVVSSGVSIEHRGAPHFDHGIFIGSGAAITPADALQMMGRVRYLRSWTVAVLPNHQHGIDSEQAILTAASEAARFEGLTGECTTFDRLVAGIRADDEQARADFAAGLWWGMERQGFTVERLAPHSDIDDEAIQHTRDALKAEHIQQILDAPDISPEEAESLSRADGQTEDGKYKLLRHRIMRSMGMAELDEDVIAAWDNGRGPVQMDRFSAATDQLADLLDDAGPDLTQKRFTKARALAYGLLFDGIDLKPGMRITLALAELILGRVIEHRFMMAYLGIVAAKYARNPGEPFPMPAYPVREVLDILARMGLKTKRREGSATPTCGSFSNENLGHVGVNPANRERCRFYEISTESWYRMVWWAERRNQNRRTETAQMPDWQAIASQPCEEPAKIVESKPAIQAARSPQLPWAHDKSPGGITHAPIAITFNVGDWWPDDADDALEAWAASQVPRVVTLETLSEDAA